MARIAVIDLEPSSTDWFQLLATAGLEVELVAEPAEISSQVVLAVVHAGARISAAEETCWQLRERFATLPVITASSGSYASEGARLVAAGARDHVRLPAHPQDLRFRIEAHLSYVRELALAPPAEEVTDSVGTAEVEPSDTLRALFQSLPMAVLASDRRGRLLLFNRAAERLLGCARQAAMAEHVIGDFFVEPAEVPRLERELSSVAPGDTTSRDVRVRTMLGEQVPVRFYGAGVRNARGRVVAFVGLLQDMRELNTMTRRLEETTRQLIETEVRAKEAIGGRNMAHELNQPLTVAMGSIELLTTRGDLDEDVQQRLERVYDTLYRMASLVRELPYERHVPGAGALGEPNLP
ncbi:MAG: histidine kinase dimerization/phospho-acceptor domain-containing protein [Pseudomonadota bacterium]